MDDILTGVSIVGFVLLIVGGGAYAVVQLKWRAEAAERALRNERMRTSRLLMEHGIQPPPPAPSPEPQGPAQPAPAEPPPSAAQVVAHELPVLRPRPRPPVPRPMAQPPAGVHATLAHIRSALPEPFRSDPYLFSLGWEEADGKGDIVAASLYGDSEIKANHGLVTGENDSGKGVFVFQVLWMLCAKLTPAQFRVVWIDPKRDGALLKRMSHLWCEPCMDDAAIMGAFELLALERRRRTVIRERAEVLRWEELDPATRPPMIWVYIGELDLITQVIQRQLGLSPSQAEEWLDNWLTGELVSARAEGMRYVVDVQDPANRKMRWRKQMAWFAAGYTSTWKGIEPALNATMDEIKAAGAQLPNSFSAPGYFTVRVRSDFATVRAPLVDLPTRKAAIAELPHDETGTPVADRLAEVMQDARTIDLDVAPIERAPAGTASENAPGIDYTAPFTSQRRDSSQPTDEQIAQWRERVLDWNAQGMPRYKMVEQMGMRHRTAYRLIDLVLGTPEAAQESAPTLTVIGQLPQSV